MDDGASPATSDTCPRAPGSRRRRRIPIRSRRRACGDLIEERRDHDGPDALGAAVGRRPRIRTGESPPARDDRTQRRIRQHPRAGCGERVGDTEFVEDRFDLVKDRIGIGQAGQSGSRRRCADFALASADVLQVAPRSAPKSATRSPSPTSTETVTPVVELEDPEPIDHPVNGRAKSAARHA
jgi:hypothetical protein